MARSAAAASLVLAGMLLAAGCGGEGSDSDAAQQTAAGAVPRPERGAADEVALTECRRGSGSKIRVAGMTCAEAAPITKNITTAFADEKLRRDVVDRGNGWRCFQRLFLGATAVEQVCWHGDRQVLIFQK